MKIVFLGTPEFAVASLDALVSAGFEIAGVVTAADKPAGRGQAIKESAVKKYAEAHALPLLQPTNLKDPEFLRQLRQWNADVQVVVAFRMLPEQVWNMPPFGTFNVHASLLPRYRGAAPINRAIMDGAEETGVTVFRLKHAVDTGSIFLQEPHKIGAETTAGELHEELKEIGAALIVRAMGMVANAKSTGEKLEFREQNEKMVTHAPKIFREDCELDWDMSVRRIHDHIRGLSPFPGAFTRLVAQGKSVSIKILRAKPSGEGPPATNGSLVADPAGVLRVRCGDGWLELTEVQVEGKRRMRVSEFLRGWRLKGGETLARPPAAETGAGQA